jgi:hypothetical protein
MPTKQWTDERSLIVAWLTRKQKAAFLRACRKKGIGQSRAIREAIQAMLGLPENEELTDA